MGADERAIRELHSTWIDAVNAGDLVRLLTMMADDVVFLDSGRRRSAGMDFPPSSRPPTNKLGSVAAASWKRWWSSAKSPTRGPGTRYP